MANKSTLISNINGFITAIITQSKVRNAYLELVNSLFQTTTVQTLTTGSDVFWYNLRYKKIGNIVYIDGSITNKYTISKSGVVVVTIPDSLFYAKTGQDTIAIGVTESTGTNVLVSFATSSIYLIGTIGAGQRIYINQHYQTND